MGNAEIGMRAAICWSVFPLPLDSVETWLEAVIAVTNNMAPANQTPPGRMPEVTNFVTIRVWPNPNMPALLRRFSDDASGKWAQAMGVFKPAML